MLQLSRSISALSRRGPALLVAAAISSGCGPLSDAAPDVVRDAAGLFEPAQRDAIEAQHSFLRRDHGIDYRVETVRGAGDLDRYAVDRFAALAVGDAGRDGRGLLLVIDSDADQVRLEVGRALEGSFPDAFIAYLEQRQMVPFFRVGRVGEGVLAATELIVARAQGEAAGGGPSDPASRGSAGAGARAHARIGESASRAAYEGPPSRAGETPEATLSSYLASMRARDPDPNLDVYSAATRAMLASSVMAPAQMDTLVRAYRDCRAEPAQVDADGTHAVIRHPAVQRGCAPWFFVREAGRWRLDFAAAASVIRFGRDNSWHFATGAAHPYAFAFSDWRFDHNGFPRR